MTASRRDAILSGALLLGLTGVASAPSDAKETAIWSGEYWAQKGDVRLAMYRKRLGTPVPGRETKPIAFFVHGSSNSARSSFDLSVPGKGEYSIMNAFARLGYDVWTMDHEGYGRSSRTSGNSDIASGAADLVAASAVVKRETGRDRWHMMGESSGALRACLFAEQHPENVERLVLAAFTYTGRGAPTLAERAKQLDNYRAHNRRPRDAAMIRSIFTRDRPEVYDMAVADAMIKAELPFGDDVPSGSYLDMTANLPMVDPVKVSTPVLLVRGEYDGIATMEDIGDFFSKLPGGDKQFIVLPDAAHAVGWGRNRMQYWHVMHAFFSMPPDLKA